MTFYQAIKHLEHSSHYSDLYLVVSKEANKIMKQYGITGEVFTDNVTGKRTYDIPFMYEPYWEGVNKRCSV